MATPGHFLLPWELRHENCNDLQERKGVRENIDFLRRHADETALRHAQRARGLTAKIVQLVASRHKRPAATGTYSFTRWSSAWLLIQALVLIVLVVIARCD